MRISSRQHQTYIASNEDAGGRTPRLINVSLWCAIACSAELCAARPSAWTATTGSIALVRPHYMPSCQSKIFVFRSNCSLSANECMLALYCSAIKLSYVIIDTIANNWPITSSAARQRIRSAWTLFQVQAVMSKLFQLRHQPDNESLRNFFPRVSEQLCNNNTNVH